MKKSPALEAPIPQFSLIEGGKADVPITKPDGKVPTNNWLKDIPPQTKFLSKSKRMGGAYLDFYGVLQHTEKSALLYQFLPRFGDTTHIWVDTATFSKDNTLHEIVENPPQEEDVNEQHYLPQPEPREEHD